MSELKQPVRPFEDTFSAEKVVLEKFFKEEQEKENASKVPDLHAIADEIIKENPEKAAIAKLVHLGWFIGKAMVETGGRADPETLREIFKEKLQLQEIPRKPITAVLHNARIYDHPSGKIFAIGFIEADTTKRFRDGLSIQTSEILEKDGNILHTLNSTYFVASYGIRDEV